MIIKVKVVPKSSKISIAKKDGFYHVKLTAAPEKGKANAQLIDVLSKFFNVKKSQIRILKGETSKEKIVEINS